MRRDENGERRRVYVVDGVEGYRVSWTQECSGCVEREDGHLVAGPFGCHECGHTGKRRWVYWVPFDAADLERAGPRPAEMVA